MSTGWDSISTVIVFGDYYADGLEMLLGPYINHTLDSSFI